MNKVRFFSLAFAGLFLCLATTANAAGTIPFSFYPQVDLQGRVMPGCKFYTIQAGTVSTPQNAYQDSALTLPLPNPQTCDASGRLPQMFLADGSIKVRLTSSTGVAVLTADNVLVVGASSGGGGGGTVDPTTVLATGDIKLRYGTGVLTGFVRQNGRTIGSATSGATERANADAQPLFEYLWSTDPNLAVSTGRGASANADWVANKTITLPDARNRAMAGLGDMGNSDANLFAGSAFLLGNGTILGAKLGIGTPRVLQTSNLPPITPAGTVASTVTVNNAMATTSVSLTNTQNGSGGVVHQWMYNDVAIFGAAISVSSAFTGTVGGGTSTAFDTVSPLLLVTVYVKL